MSIYICRQCGNVIDLLHSGGGSLVCCRQPMEFLTANTTEASAEKHLPVLDRNGNILTVRVGSEEHPMSEDHYIMWIAVAVDGLVQRKFLSPGEKPQAVFEVSDGKLEVFAYCNLHGLWKV